MIKGKRGGSAPEAISGAAQPDLFGAPTSSRNARTPPGSHPPFSKTRPPGAPLAQRHAAPSIAGGLLNVRQAGARLGLSKSTLDKMRCAGKGPRFIKSTDRAVRYDPADLDAWIKNRRRQSTRETP